MYKVEIARKYGVSRQYICEFAKRKGIIDVNQLEQEYLKNKNRKKSRAKPPEPKSGFIYICKMKHEGEYYYKIGRAKNLVKREIGLKCANPFIFLIAIKHSDNYTADEANIQKYVSAYHFQGEWYKLAKEQYLQLFKDGGFIEYKGACAEPGIRII